MEYHLTPLNLQLGQGLAAPVVALNSRGPGTGAGARRLPVHGQHHILLAAGQQRLLWARAAAAKSNWGTDAVACRAMVRWLPCQLAAGTLCCCSGAHSSMRPGPAAERLLGAFHAPLAAPLPTITRPLPCRCSCTWTLKRPPCSTQPWRRLCEAHATTSRCRQGGRRLCGRRLCGRRLCCAASLLLASRAAAAGMSFALRGCDHCVQLFCAPALSSCPMSLHPIPLAPFAAVLLPGLPHCVLGARPHQHDAHHVPRTAAGTAGQLVAAVGQGPPLRRPPLVRPPACLLSLPLGWCSNWRGCGAEQAMLLLWVGALHAHAWHCIMQRERGAPTYCGHLQAPSRRVCGLFASSMHRPCVPPSHCRADPAGERVIGERAPFEAEGKYVSQWLPKALALVRAQLPGLGSGSLPACSWQPACLQLAACSLLAGLLHAGLLHAGLRHVLNTGVRLSKSGVRSPEMVTNSLALCQDERMLLSMLCLCCADSCHAMLCCAPCAGAQEAG